QSLDEVEIRGHCSDHVIGVGPTIRGQTQVPHRDDSAAVFGSDFFPQLSPAGRKLDAIHVHRGRLSGSKHVEPSPVSAPFNGGLAGKGSGDGSLLPAIDRDEEDSIVSLESQCDPLSISRNRADVLGATRQRSWSATGEVEDPISVLPSWLRAVENDPVPVWKEATVDRLHVSDRQVARIADSDRVEPEFLVKERERPT